MLMVYAHKLAVVMYRKDEYAKPGNRILTIFMLIKVRAIVFGTTNTFFVDYPKEIVEIK